MLTIMDPGWVKKLAEENAALRAQLAAEQAAHGVALADLAMAKEQAGALREAAREASNYLARLMDNDHIPCTGRGGEVAAVLNAALADAPTPDPDPYSALTDEEFCRQAGIPIRDAEDA